MASGRAELEAEQHGAEGCSELTEDRRDALLAVIAGELRQGGSCGLSLGRDDLLDHRAPALELRLGPDASGDRRDRDVEDLGGTGQLGHMALGDIGDLLQSDALQGVGVGLGLPIGGDADRQGTGGFEPGSSATLAAEDLEQISEQSVEGALRLFHGALDPTGRLPA